MCERERERKRQREKERERKRKRWDLKAEKRGVGDEWGEDL
jgi:hypothetical protein